MKHEHNVLCAALCLLLGPWLLSISAASAAPACRVTVQSVLNLAGRVDSLLPAANGPMLILDGVPSSTVRFLPRDTLLFAPDHRRNMHLRTIGLPTYLAPPGLSAGYGGSRLYVLVDSSLISIDGMTGHVLARQDLHLQAVGWPAAFSAGPGGDMYLIGQPAGAMAAQAYAFVVGAHGVIVRRWQTALGLTHAGAWLGLVSRNILGVYAPDQHDAQGEMLLLDRLRGTLRSSYYASLPPLGASAALHLLYLGGTGTIRALDALTGRLAAMAVGTAPFAAGGPGGLVAFARGARLIIATPGRLTTLVTAALPGGSAPTALAWQGSTLVVGAAHGIIRLALPACARLSKRP